MKRLLISILASAGVLFGCQQAELLDPNDNGGQPMKTVTISTEMCGDDTKAALDSETGEFSWQSGDVISVLATDDKFYDFTLTSGADSKFAEFTGNLPKDAQIIKKENPKWPFTDKNTDMSQVQVDAEGKKYVVLEQGPSAWVRGYIKAPFRDTETGEIIWIEKHGLPE